MSELQLTIQRVPGEQEIKDRIAAMAKVLPADLLSKLKFSTVSWTTLTSQSSTLIVV